MSLMFPAAIKDPGYGYPSPRMFGGVMRQAMWVIYQMAGALVIAGALRTVDLLIANVLCRPIPGYRPIVASEVSPRSTAQRAAVGQTPYTDVSRC